MKHPCFFEFEWTKSKETNSNRVRVDHLENFLFDTFKIDLFLVGVEGERGGRVVAVSVRERVEQVREGGGGEI